MTNHKNRTPVYRVATLSGRFDHVATKAAAIAKARELADAPLGVSLKALANEWGVTIERVSAETARSVGL